MLNLIQIQLTVLLASARAAIQSIESMLMPVPVNAMVPVPVNGRTKPVSCISRDHGYQPIAGITASGAVRIQAAPVTEEWRSLDFGKTKTGNNRHSQPSRFAT